MAACSPVGVGNRITSSLMTYPSFPEPSNTIFTLRGCPLMPGEQDHGGGDRDSADEHGGPDSGHRARIR